MNTDEQLEKIRAQIHATAGHGAAEATLINVAALFILEARARADEAATLARMYAAMPDGKLLGLEARIHNLKVKNASLEEKVEALASENRDLRDMHPPTRIWP